MGTDSWGTGRVGSRRRRLGGRQRPHGNRRLRGDRRLRADHGMATVEMAMLAPLFLIGLLMIAQVLAWATAQLCASYAANHALQTTRIQGGTAAAGQDDATAVLAGIDGSLIGDPQITATRAATTA